MCALQSCHSKLRNRLYPIAWRDKGSKICWSLCRFVYQQGVFNPLRSRLRSFLRRSLD